MIRLQLHQVLQRCGVVPRHPLPHDSNRGRGSEHECRRENGLSAVRVPLAVPEELYRIAGKHLAFTFFSVRPCTESFCSYDFSIQLSDPHFRLNA